MHTNSWSCSGRSGKKWELWASAMGHQTIFTRDRPENHFGDTNTSCIADICAHRHLCGGTDAFACGCREALGITFDRYEKYSQANSYSPTEQPSHPVLALPCAPAKYPAPARLDRCVTRLLHILIRAFSNLLRLL